MSTRIRLFDRPKHQQNACLLAAPEGATMAQAIASAKRYCSAFELSGTGPDREVWAYDCLGGLRFEARRRDNKCYIIDT